MPKYAIEMCQIMKIGQIVVLCDLPDTRLTVPARKPSPSSKEYLNLVSVCSKRCGRNNKAYLIVHLSHYVTKQQCTSDSNDALVTCAQSVPRARGNPCAKGCNSSASQWLSGEQVRLCLGHPKVHFGTIVGSFWGGGGGYARWVLRAPSLQ